MLLDIAAAFPFVVLAAGSALTAAFYIFIDAELNPPTRSSTTIIRTTAEGLSLVARSRMLRRLIVMQMGSNCAINGALFLTILSLEASGYAGWIIGLARTAIGAIGIAGALTTRFFQKTFSFAALQVGTTLWITLCITVAALTEATLWMVIPLGLSVLTAPAAGAVIFATLHELIAEEAFGRVTTIQNTLVTSISAMWDTPLGAIGHRWTLAQGLWACAGIGALSVIPALLFVREVNNQQGR
ncbi:Hypothetical Protein NG00_00336 [Corynebacterium camporealensis]|uniref:Uncharacterized protein n=1 Tax=Corynebacterium camporealensis TaxID=161896 RepID=A0A0F6TAL9_9CORY|nr:hypothetical protein [Corynebacterium camporealensis]AKE38361.1 hypothetical protein UL81_01900 [Corynebacterium camporealensis]AVH87665.1 Hypothetical Protein NG00_00336 [Corynebacterium camporealensis]